VRACVRASLSAHAYRKVLEESGAHLFKELVHSTRVKMKIGLLKNFLHYFNLRQGTILIAIFQLVMTISFFLERVRATKKFEICEKIQFRSFHPDSV